MHIRLRKRDVDAFGIKALLDRFVQVEVHRPIVGGIDPWPHHEIDTRITEFGDRDRRRRVVEDAFLGAEDILQHLAYLVQVVAVADTDDEIDAAGRLGGVVDDVAADDAGVRHDDGLVVTGAYLGREDLDFLHDPCRTSGFDEITVGLFGLEAEADFGTVPFSSSEMVSNTLGGQVDAMFEEYGPARGLYDSGDMRPLVVFSEERLPVLEDVPTATEKGWDVTLGRWRAFAMQADDSAENAETLYADIEEAVATESYKKFEEQNALQYRSELLGPDEFQTFIDGEIETYTTVLRELGYIE